MRAIFLSIMVILFFVPLSASLETSSSYGKVRRVMITGSDKTIYQTIPIAIGEVVVITFPAGITLLGLPVIGDSSLIRAEIESSPLRMRMWGMIFAGSSEEGMIGVSSNMQFSLSSGQSFILKIEIAKEDSSVSRLEISYPEWEREHKDMQSKIAQYKREVDATLKKRFENLESEAGVRLKLVLAKSFAEFFQCNNYSVRAENRLVFLSSDRICKIGVDGFIVVNFRLKNRSKKRFHIDGVRLYAIREGSRVEVDMPTVFLQKYSMLFDEVISGGIAFKVTDDEYATRYELELKESAGKQRILKIPLSF
ncbi:hypothetical protein KAH37_07915 [bacterium]|nr:hypothetical protein [bacterium]